MVDDLIGLKTNSDRQSLVHNLIIDEPMPLLGNLLAVIETLDFTILRQDDRSCYNRTSQGVLAFNADDFLGNLLNFNIFFTLFVSLLAMWGFKERRWLLFLGCVLLLAFVNFDYSVTGVMLMLIFYLCRQKPALGALLYTLSYLPALWGGSPEDPLACHLGPLWISFEFFALLALPLIFFRTRTGLRIPKWFFYGYYPAHLLAIFLVRTLLHI